MHRTNGTAVRCQVTLKHARRFHSGASGETGCHASPRDGTEWWLTTKLTGVPVPHALNGFVKYQGSLVVSLVRHTHQASGALFQRPSSPCGR